MCHGVFDVVHPGHLRHLLYAKSKADILVASLTADRHISKGRYRPHVPQDLRAVNLAAFEIVDYVIIDPEPTPLKNIALIKPDIFAKGYEYQASGLPLKTQDELGLIRSYGGEIIFTPGDYVFSSSQLIEASSIHFGHGHVLMALLREIAGGALLGLIAGWLAALLLRQINDDGLQLLISLALVLGCYRLAILADLSGPIAVVAAGLCLGSPSPRLGMTPDTRAVLIGFWSPLNQILNTMLFLLMGLQILGLVVTPLELVPIVFAIPLAIVSRLVSVAVPVALTGDRIHEKWRATMILTWAGLRGGISIALALTLPDSPWRTQLLVVTYAVVVFTIVVQGLTFSRVLHSAYGAKTLQSHQS